MAIVMGREAMPCVCLAWCLFGATVLGYLAGHGCNCGPPISLHQNSAWTLISTWFHSLRTTASLLASAAPVKLTNRGTGRLQPVARRSGGWVDQLARVELISYSPFAWYMGLWVNPRPFPFSYLCYHYVIISSKNWVPISCYLFFLKVLISYRTCFKILWFSDFFYLDDIIFWPSLLQVY